MFFFELNVDVGNIKGIGAQKKKALASVGINTVGDLLCYFPRRYDDRTKLVPLKSVLQNSVSAHASEKKSSVQVVTKATVIAHQFFGNGITKTLKIIIDDGTARGALICFNRNFLARDLLVGTKIFVAGNFSFNFNEIQSPVFIVEKASKVSEADFFKILPIYSLTGNLTQNFFRGAIKNCIENFSSTIDEELPSQILKEQNLVSINDAISQIHFPASEANLDAAKKSLKFRELFLFHSKNQQERNKLKQIKIQPLQKLFSLQNKFYATLPFKLTSEQQKVINQICDDLVLETPMERLVQGDVGSGKTLVAVSASLLAIENKKQVAFMAPTELLAKQHANTIKKLLSPLGISVALLSGAVTSQKRRLLLESLSNGEIDIVVGTHALFSEDVKFKNLALAIIDEQHKFGVMQRESLKTKGNNPHLLLLSATPIPRTLAKALYSHLDVSTIEALPLGRLPIITHLTTYEKEMDVLTRVKVALDKGEQAYFVYPKISQNETEENDFEDEEKYIFSDSDDCTQTQKNQNRCKDAESEFKKLSEGFFKNYRCALLHSKIPLDEKEKIMTEFNSGEIKILFATTVVEVGIDNPNATNMVIESANYFGLSGLHQLRGRIGRGTKQSTCYLVYDKDLTDVAKVRLRTIKNSCDGFEIAKIDLQLRGPGEIFGFKQSGDLRLRLSNLTDDLDLWEAAKEAASKIEK